MKVTAYKLQQCVLFHSQITGLINHVSASQSKNNANLDTAHNVNFFLNGYYVSTKLG